MSNLYPYNEIIFMNKYLKYFSGTLMGLMLSTSAFAAADYAVILKTLSNPFWVDMKKGIEDEAKTLGVSVDIFASPSEGDFQSQLQLFEDLSNKKLQRHRLCAAVIGEFSHACRPCVEKRHLSGQSR